LVSSAPGEILFACDVGNTRVAFALVTGDAIAQVVHVPLGGLDGLRAVLESAGAATSDAPVIVSSVHPETTEQLRCLATEMTRGSMLVAGDDFPVPVETRVDHPQRVGVDRLLAALAAHRACGGACIVVDVGTAITVDAVAPGGCFLGGAILPGPTLAARSLRQHTAALPEVDFAAADSTVDPIGGNTEAAIRSGILLGTAGAIERLVAEQRTTLGAEARIIGTGGGLDAVAERLRCLDEVRPDLVLEGLVAAWRMQA
jgi:type III pantothenate kinase